MPLNAKSGKYNMSINATIALCIPAYNAAGYLPRLLQSASAQLIPFDEILVYNDASTDNTFEVAESFGATAIAGEDNLGCAGGKNILALHAKSDWLHFHDADDDLLPNFTTVAHKWITDPKAPDIVLMHYHYKDFVTKALMGEPDYVVEEMKADPVKFTILHKVVNFAVINKKSFLGIGGFNTDPAVLYNEDRAFYTKASIAGLTFDYDPELTCINYYYPGSMSAKNAALCARAALNVWGIVKEKTGEKFNKEIADKLLENATYAATVNAWETVNASVMMANMIFPNAIPSGTDYFKWLYKVAPKRAFFIREILLKFFTNKRSTK